MLTYLDRRYELTEHTLRMFRVRSLVHHPGIFMPVAGPLGQIRGSVVKYLEKWDGPKVLSYKSTPGPFMAWHEHRDADSLVVVEDPLSAMRCWQVGISSVALLGATLGSDKVLEIQRYASMKKLPVLLALDRDMIRRTIKYTRLYGFRPVLLEDDLKDSSDDEIRARLSRR
jgi:hypothetical protein